GAACYPHQPGLSRPRRGAGTRLDRRPDGPAELHGVLPPAADIHSFGGDPLAEVSLAGAREIALTGNQLVVMTPSPVPTLQIYDWTTGARVHTWPVQGAASVPGPDQAAHVEAYGGLVLYS